MKIEDKSCENEGAFKTMIFKGFQPIVMQLVFLILFFGPNFFFIVIVFECPQNATKECKGYLF